MNDPVPQPQVDTNVAAEMMRQGIPLAGEAALISLAARLQSNEHFAEFLAGLDVRNRRIAYEQLQPHIKFALRSFLQLSAKADKIAKAQHRAKRRIYKKAGYRP